MYILVLYIYIHVYVLYILYIHVNLVGIQPYCQRWPTQLLELEAWILYHQSPHWADRQDIQPRIISHGHNWIRLTVQVEHASSIKLLWLFVDVCGVLQNCGPSLTSSALIRSAFCLMDPADSDAARLTTAETSLNIPVDSEWILSSSSSSHEAAQAAQEAQAAQQDMQELHAVEEHDHAVLAGDGVQVFRGQWDDEGVYFYQAYNDEIAEWAVQHQQFGGPQFNPTRMTWIKPSFAWVLYRSGYARKHNQTRILRVKLSAHFCCRTPKPLPVSNRRRGLQRPCAVGPRARSHVRGRQGSTRDAAPPCDPDRFEGFTLRVLYQERHRHWGCHWACAPCSSSTHCSRFKDGDVTAPARAASWKTVYAMLRSTRPH